MSSIIQGRNKVRWNKVDSGFDLMITEYGRLILLRLFLRTVRHSSHISGYVWKFIMGATEFKQVRFVLEGPFCDSWCHAGEDKAQLSAVLLH